MYIHCYSTRLPFGLIVHGLCFSQFFSYCRCTWVNMASVCVEVIAYVTRPHIHQIWKLSTILIKICIFYIVTVSYFLLCFFLYPTSWWITFSSVSDGEHASIIFLLCSGFSSVTFTCLDQFLKIRTHNLIWEQANKTSVIKNHTITRICLHVQSARRKFYK